jgi:outer membrane protein TolC
MPGPHQRSVMDAPRPVIEECAHAGGNGSGSLANLQWWQVFQAPVLQELINNALTEDKDLHLAVARVAEAHPRPTRAPVPRLGPARVAVPARSASDGSGRPALAQWRTT